MYRIQNKLAIRKYRLLRKTRRIEAATQVDSETSSSEGQGKKGKSSKPSEKTAASSRKSSKTSGPDGVSERADVGQELGNAHSGCGDIRREQQP